MIHGRIELIEERCTSCMICARECPTWCITLTSHQEKRVPAPGARPRCKARSLLPAVCCLLPAACRQTSNALTRRT